MDRTPDTVVLEARARLEPLLSSLGFELDSESLSFGGFASVTTEYVRPGDRLKFYWDGRDRMMWFAVASVEGRGFASEDRWKGLEAVGSAGRAGSVRLRVGEFLSERLLQLERALEDRFGPSIR